MKLRLSTGVVIIFSISFMFPVKLPLFYTNGPKKRGTLFLVAYFGRNSEWFEPRSHFISIVNTRGIRTAPQTFSRIAH